MRTLILGFLVFIIWAIGCRYWYVCKIKNHCGAKVEIVEDTRAKTLHLADGDKMVLENYDHFKFDNKSAVPTLNDNNKSFIDALVKYMNANPEKKLTITGNYLESEKDVVIGRWENLGLARADKIRQLLVKKGIPEDWILLNANLLSGATANLNEPVSFGIYTEKLDEEGTPDEFSKDGDTVGAQAFSFTNMSFSDANFEFNSAKFIPGQAFESYADSVLIYMTENTDKSLKLIGHTCDIGSDGANLKLGKARARSVRDYFREKGVKSKIETATDGESNPAYSNETEETKSKNRRVVVQIL